MRRPGTGGPAVRDFLQLSGIGETKRRAKMDASFAIEGTRTISSTEDESAGMKARAC